MMWKALSDSKEVVDPLTSPNTNRTWIEALAEIILAYFFTLTGMLSLAPPKLRSPYMTRPLGTAAWPYNVTGPRYSYFHTPKELSLFLPNQRTKILAPCQNTIALQSYESVVIILCIDKDTSMPLQMTRKFQITQHRNIESVYDLGRLAVQAPQSKLLDINNKTTDNISTAPPSPKEKSIAPDNTKSTLLKSDFRYKDSAERLLLQNISTTLQHKIDHTYKYIDTNDRLKIPPWFIPSMGEISSYAGRMSSNELFPLIKQILNVAYDTFQTQSAEQDSLPDNWEIYGLPLGSGRLLHLPQRHKEMPHNWNPTHIVTPRHYQGSLRRVEYRTPCYYNGVDFLPRSLLQTASPTIVYYETDLLINSEVDGYLVTNGTKAIVRLRATLTDEEKESGKAALRKQLKDNNKPATYLWSLKDLTSQDTEETSPQHQKDEVPSPSNQA